MKRHELESSEYIKNELRIRSFLKCSLKNKIVGYSDTVGHDGRTEDITDTEIELADMIDYVATFGGYIYIEKNGETVKELGVA